MRARSLLIDNSEGRIYSNQTGSNILISGLLLRNQSYNAPSTSKIVNTSNLGQKGLYFPNDSVIKTIILNTVTAPKSAKITLTVKNGVDYTNSSTLTTLVWTTLSTNSVNTTTFTPSISLTANDNLFFDVKTELVSGTGLNVYNSGAGLSVLVNYYSG